MADSEDKKIIRSKARTDVTSHALGTPNSELDTSNLPTAEALKARFQTGSIPLESDFSALIDLANIGRLSLKNLLPKGSVIMFSGAEADIPEGWALCDGSKGTPNLVGRFIRGAEKPPGGKYGGKNSMQYTPSGMVYVEPHTLTLNQIPSHAHTITAGEHSDSGPKSYVPAAVSVGQATISLLTGYSGGGVSDAHDHPAHFVGDAHSFTIEPEYYEIAFIMKL